MMFLRVSPWGTARWWRRGLQEPCEAGSGAALNALAELLTPAAGGLMWRNSKRDVAEEIGIPLQVKSAAVLATVQQTNAALGSLPALPGIALHVHDPPCALCWHPAISAATAAATHTAILTCPQPPSGSMQQPIKPHGHGDVHSISELTASLPASTIT